MPCDFAIKIDHLTKQYHHHTILNDISCEITPHQVVGIIGPNGAGKSTLLKIIAGMLEGTSGEIAIFGKSATDFPSSTIRLTSTKDLLSSSISLMQALMMRHIRWIWTS